MKTQLKNIASLQSGLYAQPDIQADTLYLQGVHFDEFGKLYQNVKPQIKSNDKVARHLLQDSDILFAAKGLNNFGVVYSGEMGKAVASSSFIIIRVNIDYNHQVLPSYLAWYLTYHPEVKLFHKQLGTTIPSISITKLSELEISIPSTERQEAIVSIQALRNREKQLIGQMETFKDQLMKNQLLTATY